MEYEIDTGSEEIIEMFCELCKKKGKSRTADGFCVDCVRYLCSKCLAYHTEFLPDHIYQDKKNMPQDVCLEQCPCHAEEIIKFYCTSCNAFFCCLCKKKNHNCCKDVNHLPQLVNQIEQGKEFKEFKHELDGLVAEIINTESIIESEKESIEVISRRALENMESSRKKFMQWLDARAEKIKREVQAMKDKDKKMIEDDISKLSVIKEQVSGVKSSVEQMEREQKRFQLFMTMKNAQGKPRRFLDDLQQMKQRSINEYEFEQLKEGNETIENRLQFGRLIFSLSKDSDRSLRENLRTVSRENEEKGKTCTAGNGMSAKQEPEVIGNIIKPKKFMTRPTKCKRSMSGNTESKVDGNVRDLQLSEGERICATKMVGSVKKKGSSELKTHVQVESGDKDGTAAIGREIKFDHIEVPGVEVQKAFIAEQLRQPLVRGKIWYILDVKWFRQWKSYVGYEKRDHYNVGESSSHPGPIDNTPIFQEGTNNLKEHLIDDLDYVPVPEKGWNKLLSWYGMLGGQTPIQRRVIMEGLYTKSLKVEVYPWHLKLCEYSNRDNQIVKIFSRSDTVGQLEQIMRVEFNIAPEKEVRLWNRYMTNMYEQLNKKDHTLQDAGVYQGQVIVIEQRNSDGTWSRQDEERT